MHPKTTDSIKKKHASIRWNPIKLGETVRVRWVFNVFMFFNAEHTQKKTIGRRRRKRPTNETPLFTGTPAPAPTAHFHDGQNGRRRSLIGRRRAWVAWTAPPSHWAKNCRADAVLPSFTEFDETPASFEWKNRTQRLACWTCRSLQRHNWVWTTPNQLES